MITKYKSVFESGNMRQEMEFIFLNHLILCMDITNREFHVKYRYENPREYFLNQLSDCNHFVTEETVPLQIAVEELNDLDFSLYSHSDMNCDVIVFKGIAVCGSEQGLGIIEQKGLSPRQLPPQRLLDDYFCAAGGDSDISEYSFAESDLTLRARILGGPAAEAALRIEELGYRVFDEVYRSPGEKDNDEERIEGLQQIYDDVKGYFSIIGEMKRLETTIEEYKSELAGLFPIHNDIANRLLGLNLQMFDAKGNRINAKAE